MTSNVLQRKQKVLLLEILLCWLIVPFMPVFPTRMHFKMVVCWQQNLLFHILTSVIQNLWSNTELKIQFLCFMFKKYLIVIYCEESVTGRLCFLFFQDFFFFFFLSRIESVNYGFSESSKRFYSISSEKCQPS